MSLFRAIFWRRQSRKERRILGIENARLISELEICHRLVRDSERRAAEGLEQEFSGHYYDWRLRRLTAIIEHFGAGWFRGKRVLELAAGYGDIGAGLVTLGADVWFVEGRPDNVEVLRARYHSVPGDRVICFDLENGLPDLGRFDLILHLGILYHLDNWRASIQTCAGRTDHLVLETETCDSGDPTYEVKVSEDDDRMDQSFSGLGSRPSPAFVEAEMRRSGFEPEVVSDARCNSSFHVYDWPLKNTGLYSDGLRRFWFAKATNH